MVTVNHYKLDPAHGATVEYWLQRHSSRIERLEQALGENTKGRKRTNEIQAEIASRKAHIAILTGDK